MVKVEYSQMYAQVKMILYVDVMLILTTQMTPTANAVASLTFIWDVEAMLHTHLIEP